LLLIVVTIVSRTRRPEERSGVPGPDLSAVAWPVRHLANVERRALLIHLRGAMVREWQLPSRPPHPIFVDRTTSPALAQVANGSGLLLTGGDMQLIQIRTRRPVLINGGGLDGLPYALESGPA